jgi:succinylarginine dihydrolase
MARGDARGRPWPVTLTKDAGGDATIAFRLEQSQLAVLVKTSEDAVDLGAFKNEIIATIRPCIDL